MKYSETQVLLALAFVVQSMMSCKSHLFGIYGIFSARDLCHSKDAL